MSFFDPAAQEGLELITSFDFDVAAMLEVAASLFNGLWPLFAIVAGLSLAAGLLTLIVQEIRRIF